ncbi:MAG: DUF1707 domain-containing protein [Streptosporangiales bacterium]|jgi:hypothetical protein|nr:DUF1707 domain-containing protein [Streptosporangiales bacterium]
MSPSSTQSWTRRVRPGYYDTLRVSDAERSEVAELLGRHYSDGRLDKTELDERVSRAMSAKTRGDLNGLFDDLPDLGSAGAGEEPDDRDGDRPGGLATGPYRVGRRGGRAHPILVVAAAIVALSIAGHIIAHVLFAPWLVAIIALVAVVALVSRNRHHRDYRR